MKVYIASSHGYEVGGKLVYVPTVVYPIKEEFEVTAEEFVEMLKIITTQDYPGRVGSPLICWEQESKRMVVQLYNNYLE